MPVKADTPKKHYTTHGGAPANVFGNTLPTRRPGGWVGGKGKTTKSAAQRLRRKTFATKKIQNHDKIARH